MAANSTCYLGDITSITNQVYIAAYRVIPPFYFIIGILSRSISLAAFYRQYREEKAFAYQFLASLSDLVEVVTVTLYILTRNNLSGYRLPGVLWYQENYSLMWYAAHLSSPLEQGFVTISLLMALSMAADRVFAMAKPFAYKNANHYRNQLLAFICCFVLGLSTSAFDLFRYQVRLKGASNVLYEIFVDNAYIASGVAIGFDIIRNTVRIAGNVALVACNVSMIALYRANAQKVEVSDTNKERALKRKFKQKQLLILTLCQSFFTTIDLTMYNIYYTMVYTSPNFTNCFGKIFSPVCSAVLQLASLLEFFVLFAVSKQFRDVIISCLKWKNNEVITTAGGPSAH